MPRRATATSFGGKRGNPRGDPAKAGALGGRPTQTFEKRMAYLAQKAADSERWMRILADDSDSSDRDFVAAAKEVWDRHKGKPSQAVDVTSGGQPLNLTAAERRAELAALLGLSEP